MKRHILLAACCVLWSCDGGSQKGTQYEPFILKFDKTLTHPNGLVVNRPLGFEEFVTEKGFDFRLDCFKQGTSPSCLRMGSIILERRDIKPEPLSEFTESNEGMGGTEYFMLKSKQSGQYWIVVTAHEVRGGGSDIFSIALKILENAEILCCPQQGHGTP